MELWFALTVVSALFTGFQMFMYKIIAERSYDVALINLYAALFSAVLLFIVAALLGEGYVLSGYILFLAVVVAALFMASNMFRNISLQAIDTAIFFPLYKVFGPLFVICGGLLFFSESFTGVEWVGLILSLAVPVLLISRSEKGRQKNLLKGLGFLFVTTILAVVIALLSKEMSQSTTNIWFMLAVGDMFLAVIAGILFVLKSRGSAVSFGAQVKNNSTRPFVLIAIMLGFLQAVAYVFLMFAYRDGPVGIVYTIHSLYILIPIVLAIMYYHEHWSARKVIAVILSIAALSFLK